MKKQKNSKISRWTEKVKNFRKAKSPNYPAPRDGIVMHIDELKEKLMAIQTKFGVDPNLLSTLPVKR